MKFCDYCGRQLDDQARFCDGCGRTQHFYPATPQRTDTNYPGLRPPAEYPTPAPQSYEPYQPPPAQYPPRGFTPQPDAQAPASATQSTPTTALKMPEIPVEWKAMLLFTIALITRYLFLQVVGYGYTGWYVDSFHHWQIAFYTLHIGLEQNPPRMWDLSGQEYFWGPLPTLTESFLLYVFNTTTLTPFRIYDSVVGSISVVLIYFVGRRYFFDNLGFVAGLATALSPVLWEVDTSGMLDPMGITLLLFALLLYRRKNYWTGFVLGLASLVHIEFWFLALAMIAFYLVFEKSGTQFLPALVGWLTVMVPYFYMLQVEIGDWLYPLRYNLFSSVGGSGIGSLSVPFQAQILPRAGFVIMLMLAVGYVLKLLAQKPPSYPAHGFFLSRVAMHGIIFGLTPYIIPYIAFGQIPRVLIDRLFALEYYYLPFVVGVIILGVFKRAHETRYRLFTQPRTFSKPNGDRTPAPERHSEMRGRLVGILLILLLFNAATVPLVMYEYYTDWGSYQYQLQLADFISAHYTGGTVLNSLVTVNYRLINDGVPYQHVLGTLYCPTSGGAVAKDWLIKNNVSWVIPDQNIDTCYPSILGNSTAFHLEFGTLPSAVYSVNPQELPSS